MQLKMEIIVARNMSTSTELQPSMAKTVMIKAEVRIRLVSHRSSEHSMCCDAGRYHAVPMSFKIEAPRQIWKSFKPIGQVWPRSAFQVPADAAVIGYAEHVVTGAMG